MKIKTLVLVSGGLDSLLAAKIMLDQNIDVTLLHFLSIFSPRPDANSRRGVSDFAKRFGLPLIQPPMHHFLARAVTSPKFGLGKNMNPCVDCKIGLLRAAAELMPKEGAQFITTGEVVGQRPMSQVREKIGLIEKQSGLKGLILRPLSAKLLPPSIPEQNGWVEREKLYAISGRGRKEQMRLAEELGIGKYPSPAGGCLLTFPEFGLKARDLVRNSETTIHDFHLLKFGRHFRLESGIKLIVGRNERDNNLIYSFANPGDTLLEPSTIPGPSVLLKYRASDSDIKIAARILLRYTKLGSDESAEINITDHARNIKETIRETPLPEHLSAKLKIGL